MTSVSIIENSLNRLLETWRDLDVCSPKFPLGHHHCKCHDYIDRCLNNVAESMTRIDSQEQQLRTTLKAALEELMEKLKVNCQRLGLEVEEVLSIELPIQPSLWNEEKVRIAIQLVEEKIEQTELEAKELHQKIYHLECLLDLDFDNADTPPPTAQLDITPKGLQRLKDSISSLDNKRLERESLFMDTCSSIQELWEKLDISPTSLFDNAIQEILQFRKKKQLGMQSDSPSLYEFPLLPPIMDLSTRTHEQLKQYIAELRVSHLDKVKKSIQQLWADLDIPADKQMDIQWDGSFNDMDVDRYFQELERLERLLHEKLRDKGDSLLKELQRWWDLSHIPQTERDILLQSIHTGHYNNQSLIKLAEMIQAAKLVYERMKGIIDLIEKRKKLITDMIEFEEKASDPKRLFQSSFRLVEEEKFRKTCVPNLLKYEKDIKSKIENYEREYSKSFLYEEEKYLVTLEKEIEQRYVDTGIFQFFVGGHESIKSLSGKDSPGMVLQPQQTPSRGKKWMPSGRTPSVCVAEGSGRKEMRTSQRRVRSSTADMATMSPQTPSRECLKKELLTPARKSSLCLKPSSSVRRIPSSHVVSGRKGKHERSLSHHETTPSLVHELVYTLNSDDPKENNVFSDENQIPDLLSRIPGQPEVSSILEKDSKSGKKKAQRCPLVETH